MNDGQYRVSIPWKGDKMVLPNNYSMALRRLQNLEKTLLRDPEIAKSYQEIICRYLEKGYIREIKQTEKCKANWYLPHFAITKPGRVTTKTRIVFDASAKCNGISLNDLIFKGLNFNRDYLMFC